MPRSSLLTLCAKTPKPAIITTMASAAGMLSLSNAHTVVRDTLAQRMNWYSLFTAQT